ncbi:hypothetical protein D3C72_2410680 [compost metagenome]
MAQVQAAMERAGRVGFDQSLGHAAGGGGAKLEVEITQFALKDLAVRQWACQQADEQ